MANSSEMKLMLRILANAVGLKNEMAGSTSSVRRFVSRSKQEFNSLKSSLSSLQGTLAGIGVTLGAIQQIRLSARLDKDLTQITQTAGIARAEARGLRAEFFDMGKETGKQIEELKEGYNVLVQSGLSAEESRETLKGINVAMAVTSAQAQSLAGALTVASTAFDFDLSKPGLALVLLDKMTAAGRLGNAELENLSTIFGRVGVNARTAGFSFDKTLAFIETLSLIERNPERLATLVDSTLRIFTNARYMQAASRATGVRFFDAEGNRRDALDVLNDIRAQYGKLTSDQARSRFIQKAFGDADLDTIKGIRTLLSGEILSKSTIFNEQISSAGGTLKNDLDDAIDNAVDQTGRLKNVLREAADSFVQPINAALKEAIKFGLDSKDKGGLGLTGNQIILGGAGLVAGTLLTARLGNTALKSVASRLMKRGGSIAAGVAEGKALEYAAGVTPVFVVNWPGSGVSAGSGTLPGVGAAKSFSKSLDTSLTKWIKGAGWLGAGGNALAATGALAAGFGVGTLLNKGMGWVSGKLTGGRYEGDGWLGAAIYDLVHRETKNEINMDIHIDEQGRVKTDVDSMDTHVTTQSNRGAFW